MATGIPIVIQVEDRGVAQALNRLQQRLAGVSNATRRWGQASQQAANTAVAGVKNLQMNFLSLLGKYMTLRFAASKMFEGLTGLGQLQQMKMSFAILGNNLDEFRMITRGLVSDLDLLRIGISLTTVGIGQDLTKSFLKSGTAAQQVFGSLINLEGLIESIIQGRTFRYFDKYLPGIAKYAVELQAAEKEADNLIRTQKILTIVMKHMDDITAGTYGHTSKLNQVMMKLNATFGTLKQTFLPIIEGGGMFALFATSGLGFRPGFITNLFLKPLVRVSSSFGKVKKDVKSWAASIKGLMRTVWRDVLGLGTIIEPKVTKQGWKRLFGPYGLRLWIKQSAQAFIPFIANIVKFIGGLLAIPAAIFIVRGVFKGLGLDAKKLSLLWRGITEVFKGYNIETRKFAMSKSLQKQLEQGGLLGAIRNIAWTVDQAIQLFLGFKDATELVGEGIVTLMKPLGAFGFTMGDLFGEQGSSTRWIGRIMGLVGAFSALNLVLKPLVGLAVALGPAIFALTSIGLALNTLVSAMGGLEQTVVGVAIVIKAAFYNILLAITNVVDGLLVMVNRLARFLPFEISKYHMGDIARLVGMDPNYTLQGDMEAEYKKYINAKQAISSADYRMAHPSPSKVEAPVLRYRGTTGPDTEGPVLRYKGTTGPAVKEDTMWASIRDNIQRIADNIQDIPEKVLEANRRSR